MTNSTSLSRSDSRDSDRETEMVPKATIKLWQLNSSWAKILVTIAATVKTTGRVKLRSVKGESGLRHAVREQENRELRLAWNDLAWNASENLGTSKKFILEF